MGSGKNQTNTTSKTSNTNGDDLRRALNWIVNKKMFAKVTLHGNVAWNVAALVRLAVFWVWNSNLTLVDAANDAIACVKRVFGESSVNSYQSLTNALKRYTSQILPVLRHRMQALMQQCDDDHFRVGIWLALAVDGSRLGVPRTRPNERQFCKAKRKTKKKNTKKRGRHAKGKQPTHKKKYYQPQPVGPQMWLTMIWHIGQRLPWSWKTGPSYSSERHHVLEMLQEQKFPKNTLFCGDAGFVGYDFWRTIDDDHHFLVRIGGNVRLLKNLGYVRERNGIVYCWPESAMKKKQPPLVLRLLHFKNHRNADIYLVTNVLDRKKLPDQEAGEIFRKRWGIEVQFRSLKQTYGRSKLRSRTPDCAAVELDWSLVGLWMIQLLAHKEQTKAREPNGQTSVAAVLRIVQEMMNRDTAVPSPHLTLKKQLAKAVTDNYKRKSKKKSRNYPRRKEEPATSKPKIKTATKKHKLQLEELQRDLSLANAP